MTDKKATEACLNNRQKIFETLKDTEVFVKLILSRETDPLCKTTAIALLRSLEDLVKKGVLYNKTLFVYKPLK